MAADTSGHLSQERSWLRSVPSIALTDDYNFIEYDLRNILSAEMEKAGLEGLPTENRETVLALPKAECDNPLMWTILAHELAHAMINWYKIRDAILERSEEYQSMEQDQKHSYRNWITEICADLIALRLLGPSYFFSFTSMGFMLMPPRSLRADHPTFITRAGTMEKVLGDKFPNWSVPIPYPNLPTNEKGKSAVGGDDLISFFFVLAQYNHEFRVKVLSEYRHEYQPEIEDQTKKMNLSADTDMILDVLERVRAPVADLASPENLIKLHENLAQGQPMSSEASSFDKIEFHNNLRIAKTSQDLYRILACSRDSIYAFLTFGRWMDVENLYKLWQSLAGNRIARFYC